MPPLHEFDSAVNNASRSTRVQIEHSGSENATCWVREKEEGSSDPAGGEKSKVCIFKREVEINYTEGEMNRHRMDA